MFKHKKNNYLDLLSNYLEDTKAAKSISSSSKIFNIALAAMIFADVLNSWSKIKRLKRIQKSINYGIVIGAAVLSGIKLIRK